MRRRLHMNFSEMARHREVGGGCIEEKKVGHSTHGQEENARKSN
jgi:hypothetical protein